MEDLFPQKTYNPLTKEPTTDDHNWLRDRLRDRFTGMSWLLSAESEEETYTLATLLVPKIVESVGHQGPAAILASMALTEKQQRAIQVFTTGQRTNPNWHLKMEANRQQLVNLSKAQDGVLSVQWGIVNESEG